jgi:hypothetical protein
MVRFLEGKRINFSCWNFILPNLFALFLPSASASGAANETKNASFIGGGRQPTTRERGRGRSGTTWERLGE